VTYPPGPVIQSDLRDTYKWLNDNADSLENEILELRDELVFLNVDNPNYDEWSWHKASELAFKAQDVPGAWQAVRRFLQPFHKFLEAAGVLEFKYPKVERQDQGAMREREHTSFRGMRDTFNEMRLAGQLTDIHIAPQDASALTNLEALRAHRVFLAACNPWFKAMFTEGFREATEDARIAATQSSLESLIGQSKS
jgi:sacsin